MYTPTKVDVATSQHEKIKKALGGQKSIVVKINLRASNGNHVLLLTNAQIGRMKRARLIGKPSVSIRLSKKQVKANTQHRGGFLPMLAALAARALPMLLSGLTTGVLSGVVSKAISGNGLYPPPPPHPSSSSGGRRRRRQSGGSGGGGGDGLYLHKSGHCVKVEATKGRGLRLTPSSRTSMTDGMRQRYGDGLYLKRGSHVYDGRGLLFGKNSPFKNIPILNLLL